MHTCPACGHHPAADVDLAADGADGDERAIEELTRRAQQASTPELTQILRGVRDQLKLERKGARRVADSLKRIIRGVLDWVRETLDRAPGAALGDRVINASRTLDTLAAAILEAGLGDLMAEVQAIQAQITRAAWETAQAGGTIAPGIDIAAQAALLTTSNLKTLGRYFERDVVQAIVDNVTDGLESSVIGETLDEAIQRISRSLEVTERRAKNMARTQFASFSRSVTASMAAAIDADLFFYGGPKDGLTRDFCLPLAGKTITADQLRRLDNGQGLPVVTDAGGNNCRHGLVPIMAAVAEAAGIPAATEDDINAANQGGRR